MSRAQRTAAQRRVDEVDRGAEQADDLVADVLVEGAAVAEQHVDHHLEVLVEGDDHLLGRVALAHRREAADVGEQHGDLAAGAALVQVSWPETICSTRLGESRRWNWARVWSPRARSSGQHVVLDGDRGLGGDAGEQQQVLLGEGAGGEHRVHVHRAEQLVVVEQRHAHGRADALHDDALGRLEALVDHRVGREHGALLGADLVEDALRELDLLVALLADVAGDEVVGLGVEQQDDGAVGADQQEGLVDDLLQQGVEVGVDRELLRELVGDAQLLVVGAQGRRSGTLGLSTKVIFVEPIITSSPSLRMWSPTRSPLRNVPLSERRSRSRNRPSAMRWICACSLLMMRSRIWMVLSGWRPSELNAASSNSWRSSPAMTMIFAICFPVPWHRSPEESGE
jgi:hypothetical protein